MVESQAAPERCEASGAAFGSQASEAARLSSLSLSQEALSMHADDRHDIGASLKQLGQASL